MEGERKWSVTYTKHLKQKRKVYHDGTLLLHSGNKLVLYDEGEQALDSKYITNVEAVKSGESLSFSSFLVDIGDPVSNSSCILLPDAKPECAFRTPEKTRSQFGEKRNNCPSDDILEDRKPSTIGKRAFGINLSPSQKIIREFKKNEEVKYNTKQSPTSATNSSKEWEALYTTQITQKAKKYHDGFIRLITCGSQGRQAILFDSAKTQVDKRFLKKEEIISSGESLKFDAHLVDIGDAIGSNKNDDDLKMQARNSSTEKPESGQQWQKSSDLLASNPPRSKAHMHTDHLRAGLVGSAAAIEPRQDACSSKYPVSNISSLGVGEKKQMITTPHNSIRKAHDIMSFLKKPTAQENKTTVEEAPVKQCLSEFSVSAQVNDDNLSLQFTLQSDPHQARSITEKNINDKAVRGESQIHFEGHSTQSGFDHDNVTKTEVHTGCNSDTLEKSVSVKGITLNTLNKSRASGGSMPCDKFHASVDLGQSVLLQPKIEPGVNDSLLPVSNEARSNDSQSRNNLMETSPPVKQQSAFTLNNTRLKGFGNYAAVMKMKRSTSTENSTTVDCPSFDLGI